jgi:DNA-nicking Smr family endonuclease
MQGASARAVLVITGKSGVLRRQVPLWLNAAPNRARILSFTQARIADGGEGALYILLRKVK